MSIRPHNYSFFMSFANDDRLLYQALRDDSPQAYSYLYTTLHNQFVPFACQHGGDYEAATDVLNDCMAIFIDKLRSGQYEHRPSAKITTYLNSICRRQWYNFVDKQQQLKTVSFGEQHEGAADDSHTRRSLIELADNEAEDFEEKQVMLRQLQRAMALLREDCRQVMTWFYIEDRPLRYIAEQLSMSVESATVKRHKCASYLRKHFFRL